jgi:hypothetical protein
VNGNSYVLPAASIFPGGNSSSYTGCMSFMNLCIASDRPVTADELLSLSTKVLVMPVSEISSSSKRQSDFDMTVTFPRIASYVEKIFEPASIATNSPARDCSPKVSDMIGFPQRSTFLMLKPPELELVLDVEECGISCLSAFLIEATSFLGERIERLRVLSLAMIFLRLAGATVSDVLDCVTVVPSALVVSGTVVGNVGVSVIGEGLDRVSWRSLGGPPYVGREIITGGRPATLGCCLFLLNFRPKRLPIVCIRVRLV